MTLRKSKDALYYSQDPVDTASKSVSNIPPSQDVSLVLIVEVAAVVR